MKKFIYFLFIFSFLVVSLCYAEGLHELIEIGKSQADIQKSYEQETGTYYNVKNAVKGGDIKKGQTGKEIASRYGEPVVNVREFDTGREKWIYKPAKSDFFHGEKIFLFFDKSDTLDEIRVVN
jgi:hypothetical protein